jgi:hypothetical protein
MWCVKYVLLSQPFLDQKRIVFMFKRCMLWWRSLVTCAGQHCLGTWPLFYPPPPPGAGGGGGGGVQTDRDT